MTLSLSIEELRATFGSHLQENVVMANYTTTHVGGVADALLPVNTLDELAEAASRLWALDVPFRIIGSGSNVLVSDLGLHAVILLNHAHNIKIDTHHTPPTVWAEAGANLGTIARQVGLRGLSGMEWAATIPGTLGGAVYGNAGAHGGDMAGSLILADILHRETGRDSWPVESLAYSYRSSIFKSNPIPAVILAARLRLEPGDKEEIQAKMKRFSTHRRQTQPPGASTGSMFKNPSGDYAGRLIDATGLKGHRCGGAEISPIHANFFINLGNATANDIYQLVLLTQRMVAEKFGIQLEPEIEFIGEFGL
jgi:UDP-N-acetylmuramate dehydrogenase